VPCHEFLYSESSRETKILSDSKAKKKGRSAGRIFVTSFFLFAPLRLCERPFETENFLPMPFPIDFNLPPHLIAQEPCARRDGSRLLVVRRDRQTLDHHRFSDLPELLKPGDLLILNDTRVLAARLLGHRQTGGKWEGLFVRTLPDGSWEMLCRGRLRAGEIITVESAAVDAGPLQLRLVGRLGPGRWQVEIESGASGDRASQRRAPQREYDIADVLERYGHVPLPPYIRKGRDNPEDRERYQTVFARHAGAIAAPTAGLHFTPELFDRLEQRGIERAYVTLHVGLGTFQPIQSDDFTQHVMHREWGRLPTETAESIQRCRERQGRVVAIGTTAVRVLETAAQESMKDEGGRMKASPSDSSLILHPSSLVSPWAGDTDLFICPPFRFAATDVLLTNFHLPHSTLLLLVAAFAGVPLMESAYQTAMRREYRFFSYGDAMLVL